MSSHDTVDTESGQERMAGLLDVLIRAGLILAMVALCYQVFAPFLTLMVWAIILAVTLYPMHQYLAGKMGGKQGLAATILVLLGIALIITPTAVLMSSLGDSVHQLVIDVQEHTLEIPAPPEAIATWPLVGDKLYAVWSKAHTDLPALIQSQQPKIGDIREDGARLRRGHRRRAAPVPRCLHHCRHHHGLRQGRRERQRSHLPAFHRSGARRRIHQIVHGNHTRRCQRCHWRGLHPGAHCRHLPVDRRRAMGRCPGDDRPRARNCAGARADHHPARHRVDLVDGHLRDRRGGPLHRADLRSRE